MDCWSLLLVACVSKKSGGNALCVSVFVNVPNVFAPELISCSDFIHRTQERLHAVAQVDLKLGLLGRNPENVCFFYLFVFLIKFVLGAGTEAADDVW